MSALPTPASRVGEAACAPPGAAARTSAARTALVRRRRFMARILPRGGPEGAAGGAVTVFLGVEQPLSLSPPLDAPLGSVFEERFRRQVAGRAGDRSARVGAAAAEVE